jgi:hypothetical protein
VLFLQVNDAAVSLRLVIFGSKVQITQITDQTGGGRGEGCHPSDLLCWLTVIWSGSPTAALWEASAARYISSFFRANKTTMPNKRPQDSPLLSYPDLFFTFFGSRYSSFIHRLQNKLEGDGRGERGFTPLICCVG